MGQKQHFVSEFITRPWEVSPGKLRFYDFKSKRINIEDSNKLFSREGLWPEEMENLFSGRFESLVSNLREHIVFPKKGVVNLSPKKYRAFVLLFMVQSLRGLRVDGLESDIEEFMKLSDEQLDYRVDKFMEGHLLITMPVDGHLFVPNTGFFPLPVRVRGKRDYGFGFPLDPIGGIAMVPLETDIAGLSEITNTPGVGTTFSIGHSSVTRVVIHPALYDRMGSEDRLIESIEISRKKNIYIAHLYHSEKNR